MPEYEFQLIAPLGSEPFHHSRFEELTQSVKARVPLRNIRYEGRVSEEYLRRRSGGCVAGADVPFFAVVTLDIDGDVGREYARAQLQNVVAELGRPDITVENA
jgi:hypothetical protein